MTLAFAAISTIATLAVFGFLMRDSPSGRLPTECDETEELWLDIAMLAVLIFGIAVAYFLFEV